LGFSDDFFMATSRGFFSEMFRYRVVVPGYRVEDRIEMFVLWRWRGIGEALMFGVFGLSNVLVFNISSDTSLCGLWIVLTPGIGEVCHVDKSWFNRRSNRSTVEFQVVIVVVRVDREVRIVRNKDRVWK
jgi:hypothetical protein